MVVPSLEVAEITRERDLPLSFNWRTLDTGLIQSLDLSWLEDKTRNMARNSIVTEAVLANSESRWISYSRRKEFYSGLRRYQGTAYTYTTVLAAIEELIGLDLIEEERSSPRQRGRQSRFRATPKLVAILTDAPIAYDLHELIRLKDSDKELINYRDTDATRRMRHELQDINTNLASIDLELAASDVIRTPRHLLVDGAYYRPTRPGLYRVFNDGSFSKGGRAYGWWQSLPKARRQRLLMNGEPTAEPDFAQMHASILYADRGHVLKGDAYETEEFSRALGKLAFNVALNTKDRRGTISALMNKEFWPLSRKDTGKLLDALERRNAPIAAEFYRGRGLTLMRTDSEITLVAVKECIKAGIPALPVHDSMLTPKRHEGRVAEIMEESAGRVLKRPNPCRVSFSRPPVPQMPFLLPCLAASFSASGSRGGVLASQADLFSDAAPESFSSHMKRLRDRLGLSQRALAEKIGCQQPHVANVEGGRRHLGDWPRRRLHDLMQEAA